MKAKLILINFCASWFGLAIDTEHSPLWACLIAVMWFLVSGTLFLRASRKGDYKNIANDMKTIKLKFLESRYVDRELNIVNVIHDLPTWMFPNRIKDNDRMVCPVCYQEMGMVIGHGIHIEKCSYIELGNGDVHPIHRHCYDKLTTI